jgi:hypothetical protein
VHFDTEEWADFARKRGTLESEARMQAHLEAGCRACVDTLQVWLKVMEAAGSLNVYNPPEGDVRLIKSLYHLVSPQASRYRRVEVARLLPAFPAPLAEGLRASELANRHFLFQRGDLLLDVQIELRPESRRASMTGQIMDRVQPGTRFAERTIALMCENTELARAATNQFGEFHLEFTPAEDLMLVIDLESESLLVTALPSFVPATPPPGLEINATTEKGDVRSF